MSMTPAIYIAGPYVFYRRGYTALAAMRMAAEARGFSVTLPNDTELKLDHQDLQKNGDEIFKNCADSMNRSNAIICDLEFYRGFEPDGGSVYEIGMAYAKGARCYGFSRDLRPMVMKDPTTVLDAQTTRDTAGRPYPYANLPFCPSLVATTHLVQGDFYAALSSLEWDINYESARMATSGSDSESASLGLQDSSSESGQGQPTVYLAGPERYDADATEYYSAMKSLGHELGLRVLTPADDAHGVRRIHSSDPYVQAGNDFARWEKNIRDCDAVVANLSDFHGREPNSDTAFECGMAFQLGKRLFGHMDDTRVMLERISHLGEKEEYRDQAGSVVENFDYPLNIMFASSMPIYEGGAETAIRQAAEALL